MLEAKNLNKEISIKKIDNETSNIKIFNNEILAEIVGEFNKNLIKIEKLTNTKIFFRGNSITVKGNKESILTVSNSLFFLVHKIICNSCQVPVCMHIFSASGSVKSPLPCTVLPLPLYNMTCI